MRRQVRSAIGQVWRVLMNPLLQQAGRRQRPPNLPPRSIPTTAPSRGRRGQCESATPRPRPRSRSRSAIGSAGWPRTQSSGASTSACARRCKSIARPTARAWACTWWPTPPPATWSTSPPASPPRWCARVRSRGQGAARAGRDVRPPRPGRDAARGVDAGDGAGAERGRASRAAATRPLPSRPE